MADDKIRLPSSTAGLTQYSEISVSDWQLKPGYVIIAGAGIALIVLFLHVYGARILGI
ncbi:preprotein translocase subunit Sec61beta [Candidatus Woesearchaeota archaeon]|nr:preprotein translocase subunit Sec61beta [Candidatus Woesearchaeota archaeon]